jgi:uncharacterized protein with NAD-binding domain and iron-sulfur cluster
MIMPEKNEKKKLAVLGGGLGSLSTVLCLTEQPNWQEQFEITIYQMGWRLGGKGASGRNAQNYDRIEEHGLHIWMGWYQNAFRAIRKIYDELGRSPTAPLATWDQAFKKHSFIVFGEEIEGKWTNWPNEFPADKETPGTGGAYPTLWSYIELTLKALRELLQGSLFTAPLSKKAKPRNIFQKLFWWLKRLLGLIEVEAELLALAAGEELLKAAHELAQEVAKDVGKHHRGHDDRMLQLIGDFRKWLQKRIEREFEAQDEARRLFCIVDTAVTCTIGVIAEHVGMHAHALDALDQYDFRAWLRKHGAAEDTINSSLLRAFYDLLFAYRNGDPNQQLAAAGVSIRFIFRMCLTYKGAIFWKMQAGMGDTIFAPIYEVLKKRGVEIKFFHRVKNLGLSADKKAVAQITLGRQVTLKNGAYEPLYDVKGLPCWPSQPFYEQILEGDELQRKKIDLESFWTPWQDVKALTLERGKDFDLMLFGISLASIPYLCPELIAASPKWKAMVDHLETVRTQAVQLWLKPDLKGLGWPLPSAVTDAYPEPLDTWADMSHLLPREAWPPGDEAPQNITYFCAPMIGAIPSPNDTEAPKREEAKVYHAALSWFGKNCKFLWPGATSAKGSTGLNWELLAGAKDLSGQERFNDQFFRANIDPSERYVLSLPNTTQFRLRADDRDFENLFVAGDWIYTSINAGCVEGTVMSGMLASNAICGYPKIEDIVGYAEP